MIPCGGHGRPPLTSPRRTWTSAGGPPKRRGRPGGTPWSGGERRPARMAACHRRPPGWGPPVTRASNFDRVARTEAGNSIEVAPHHATGKPRDGLSCFGGQLRIPLASRRPPSLSCLRRSGAAAEPVVFSPRLGPEAVVSPSIRCRRRLPSLARRPGQRLPFRLPSGERLRADLSITNLRVFFLASSGIFFGVFPSLFPRCCPLVYSRICIRLPRGGEGPRFRVGPPPDLAGCSAVYRGYVCSFGHLAGLTGRDSVALGV